MKIIIAGAGKVGAGIAQSLEAEGHDITLIDRDSATIDRMVNELDVICCLGNATHLDTLREAGTDQADIFMAVTESDEVNMICALAARRLGARYIVARIRDPEYLTQTEFLREAVGLSVIVNPEYECAKEISRILRFPSAVRVETFSKGSAEIIDYRVPEGSPLHGLDLLECGRRFGAKVLVSVVERGDEALIPNGDFVLRSGDKLSLMGEGRELRRFFTAVGGKRRRVKKVMIMGGSRTSVYLADLLDESGISATVFDRSRERCDELCDLIPHARVICGDAARDEVLLEEGIRSADAFVALTGDDGDNIVTAMYAKRCGVPKTVVKVNMRHFSGMLDGEGDSMITPKEIVSQQITGFVRAISNSAASSSIETIHKLAGGRIEAMEFKVGESANCLGVPLRDLKPRKGVLISAITRGEKTLIPNGSTTIESGDHAVVIAPAGMLRDINDIMGGER
ncbi:MAG: Trk system potassium transporter TrkA [Oscillospiraceae bacterium]|nr:Trk system potassium transporter TrkA [Oscillospiraceae bacterium]